MKQMKAMKRMKMSVARRFGIGVGGVFLLAGVCWGSSLYAQAGSGATQSEITFQFDWPGLAVPHFVVQLREDGTGSYQADQAARAATYSGGSITAGQAAQKIDRTMNISAGTVAKVFAEARSLNYFRGMCASKLKHIANTGDKILTYAGPDGAGSCGYNYTEDKNVTALTNTFLGIAFVMDEGRKLELLHRYDRLGLDEEMNYLKQEVEEGRGQELGTIAPTLNSIAQDTAVMERVRLAAAKMLQQGGGTTH